MELTADQVMALAPDSSSAAAGKKLAKPKDWQGLGRDSAAIWGEFQGSARYQVRAALSDLTVKCSCPSRKFPCKHGIGLLLIAATDFSAVPEATTPDWVTDWLQRREATAERREAKAHASVEGTAVTPDQAKRAAATTKRRLKRVEVGIEGIDLWLDDIVRGGLAQVSTQANSFWENQAARLTDAQAPGLANRVRQMADIPNASDNWPEQLLVEMGEVSLLTHAFRRIDELDPLLQEDLRSAIGWTLTQEEVMARGEKVRDQWRVIGRKLTLEDRLRAEWTWLHGATTGRYALLLQFAHGAAAFAPTLPPGRMIDADLVFWPSAYPQRALLGQQYGEARAFPELAGGDHSLAAMLDRNTEAMSRLPWLAQIPAILNDMSLIIADDRSWLIRDSTGATLRIRNGDHWQIMALAGGYPGDYVVEWDNQQLTLVGAFVHKKFYPVSRSDE